MPFAMYFVINGELQETRHFFDVITQQWQETVAGRLLPGDVFGHDSLLHDIPRTETVTTISKLIFIPTLFLI